MRAPSKNMKVTNIRDASLARQLIRGGQWTKPTAGLALGFAQANLIAIPKRWASSFLNFCLKNWLACPVIDITPPGAAYAPVVAPDADLRTDLPRYLIFRHGEFIDEVTEVKDVWTSDLVGFLLGCGLTVDAILLAAGIPVRNIEEGCSDPTFITNIKCCSHGPFRGSLAVSMRPIPRHLVNQAIKITSPFAMAHGQPIHVGAPSKIGIQDIFSPAFGDPVTIYPDEVPVFWACGVTSQICAVNAKLELTISHKPGYMFITDLSDGQLRATW